MPSKKKIEEILSLPGEVRGDVLKTDLKYVLEKQGREDFDRLNEEIKKIDKELGYHKITNTSWYPIGWKIMIMELGKELFDWGKKDFYNMGYSASSNSFLTRTLLRYFVSFKKTFREAAKYWKKYWNAGELEPYKMNLKEKYLILRLKDFDVHPDLCHYLRGHFKAFSGIVLSKQKMTIEETKCPYRRKSDAFHEFIIKW